MKFFYPFQTVVLFCLAIFSGTAHAQNPCLGVGGTGITGGAISVRSGFLCANVDAMGGPGAGAEIKIQAFNVRPIDNVSFAVIWDDGSPAPVQPAIQTGPTSWEILSLVHFFPVAGPDVKCEYIPRVMLFINGALCNANFGASPNFTRWNVDDQNTGNLLLSETITSTNTYLVCRGTETTVTFTDRSTLNCVPPEYDLPNPINTLQRWRRFTYGTTNTITSATGVEVGGVIESYPFQGALETADPSQNPLPPTVTLPITIPEDAQVGQEFVITMEYWNTCNPFPGTPVTETARIRIVDQPPAPTANNNTICNGSTVPDFSITIPTAFAGGIVTWFEDNSNSPGNIIAGFTGNTLPAAAIGVTGTMAGVHRVWASYYGVNNVDGLSCESPRVPVTLTIREDLVPITGFSGFVTQICKDGTMTVNLPAPATETIGGATQYGWSQGPGVGISTTSNSATFSFTGVTFPGASQNRFVSVLRRYTSGDACPSDPLTRNVNVFAASIGGTLSATPDVCETSAVGTISLTGERGTVQRWDVSVNGASFVTDIGLGSGNSISPGTLAPGNYRFKAIVANGPCSETESSIEEVNVFENPLMASVGSDQAFCQVSLTSTDLGGSNPAPGTGLWSMVSGPGTVTFNPGNTTPNATATVSTQGTYVFKWTVTNGMCSSESSIRVDFGTDPGDQFAGSDNSFCGLGGALDATPPPIGNGLWSLASFPVPPGTATFDNPMDPKSDVTVSAFGSYTFIWTVTSGTCTPETDNVVLVFNQAGTATVPADFTICVDQTLLTPIDLSGGSVGGGSTLGRWQVVSGSGTIQSSGTALGNAVGAGTLFFDRYVPAAGETSVQLRLVAQDPDGVSAPCGDVPSTNLTITIDRRPGNIFAGNNFAVCDGAAATLNASNPTNGTGRWSYVSGPDSAPVFTDVTQRNTDVTVMLPGAYVYRWTVESTLGSVGIPPAGACADQSDDVQLTVRDLPDALDPAPDDLCETVAGTLVAVGVDLTTYNDGVTGISNSTGRTVRWYASIGDQSANINPILLPVDIGDGDIFFTRVIDSSSPENCEQLGFVNFTVNSKPLAITQSRSFCEITPIGSNTVNDIDLTEADLIDDITLSLPDRTVTWFTSQADAAADANEIADPTDVDIVGNRVVFARVVNDVTGCFSVAQVNLIVKPLPADQVIRGSETPCVSGTELYRINPLSGGQYTWNIPPQFTVLGGGTVNDFFVLLEFPTEVTADIAVQISLNGCSGNTLTKSIAVSGTPAGFVINPPAATICADGTYAFSVSNNSGNSTYNWQIFKQSDNTPGGGVVTNGQTTGSVLINVDDEDISIRVTESNGSGCAGPPQQLDVDVFQRPVMKDSTKTICSGDVVGITLTESTTSPVTAATFDVRVPTILPGIAPVIGPTQSPPALAPTAISNDSYRNQTIAPTLSLLYRVTPISAVGCAGDERSIIINIKAEPLMDLALGKSVCSDEELALTLRSVSGFLPADKFEIQSPIGFNSARITPITAVPATGVLLNADAIYSAQWENISNTDEDVTYTVRPYSSLTGCYGNPAAPVTVTILRKPVVDDVIGLDPVCSGDVLNIPLTSSNVPGAQFIWTVSQVNGNITGFTGGITNAITDMLINNGVVQGSVIYEVRATNSASSPNCSGPPTFIEVFVKPSPTATGITDVVCSDFQGGNTFEEDLSSLQSSVSSGAGLTFTWFTDANDFNNTQVPAGTFTITDNVPVFVRVENGVSGCFKDVAVKYKVNPTPDITATALTTTVNTFNISCNGRNDGQINVSAIHGTGHLFSRNGTSYVPAVAFTNLGPGAYIIRTRNSEGCKDSVSVTMAEPGSITATTASIATSCFNSAAPDGEIAVNGSGGAGTLNYFLLQDPSNTSGETSGNFIGLRANNYTVRITDENGCSMVTPAIAVTQPPEPIATFSLVGPTAKCSGESFTFEWTVEADIEYRWTWGDGADSVIAANAIAPGVHQIAHQFISFDPINNSNVRVFLEARNTIASCNPVQGSGLITIYPVIFINAFNDKTEICSGDEVTFTNLTLGGSSHRWFYRRVGVNEVLEERILSVPSTQKYVFTNAGPQNPIVYEIVYEVSNGTCSNSLAMRDTVYQGMTANFNVQSVTPYMGGNALANLANTSTPLNASLFRYEWEYGVNSNPATQQGITPSQVRYTSIGDKNVRLTLTNLAAETAGLSCTSTREAVIHILLPPLQVDFEYTPQSACFPSDIKITKNLATGDRYEWTLFKNGLGLYVSNDTLPSFRITSPGEYVIKLKTWNSQFYAQRDSIDNSNNPIEIFARPFAAFEPRPEVVFAPDREGMTLFNVSTESTSWFWDFGDGDTSTEFQPEHFYQLEGKYTVTLVSSFDHILEYDFNGDGSVDQDDHLICRDTATFEVKALEAGRVRIPNAFTPDPSGPSGGYGEGLHNDVFRPLMTGVDEFQMQVYDRWGNLVFESKDINQGWDGYDRNGRLLPAGVYVYKLTMRLSSSERTTQVGDITLIR